MVPYRTGHKTGLQRLYAQRIMRTVEENYEGVVISGRRITKLRYADDTTLLASTQERIRNFSRIWYKEVHATTCISMHRSPK